MHRKNTLHRSQQGACHMIRVEHQIFIQETVETVFTALADFPAEPRWQPVVISNRQEPEGELAVGTRTIQQRMFRGKPVTTIGQLVEYVPQRKMVFRSVPDNPSKFLTSYVLEPVESGTQLSFVIELEIPGVAGLFSPLIKRGLTKDVVTRFATLKTLLETQHHV